MRGAVHTHLRRNFTVEKFCEKGKPSEVVAWSVKCASMLSGLIPSPVASVRVKQPTGGHVSRTSSLLRTGGAGLPLLPSVISPPLTVKTMGFPADGVNLTTVSIRPSELVAADAAPVKAQSTFPVRKLPSSCTIALVWFRSEDSKRL